MRVAPVAVDPAARKTGRCVRSATRTSLARASTAPRVNAKMQHGAVTACPKMPSPRLTRRRANRFRAAVFAASLAVDLKEKRAGHDLALVGRRAGQRTCTLDEEHERVGIRTMTSSNRARLYRFADSSKAAPQGGFPMTGVESGLRFPAASPARRKMPRETPISQWNSALHGSRASRWASMNHGSWLNAVQSVSAGAQRPDGPGRIAPCRRGRPTAAPTNNWRPLGAAR